MDIEQDFDDVFEPQRYWTVHRIVFTIIILITLIAFLVYAVLSNWIYASAPTPPTLEVHWI
jgi:hypothetical protein